MPYDYILLNTGLLKFHAWLLIQTGNYCMVKQYSLKYKYNYETLKWQWIKINIKIKIDPDYNYRVEDRKTTWTIFHTSLWGVSRTNNNWFSIGWLDPLALLCSNNQWWQLTVNGFLRLAPFLAGPRVRTLLLWRKKNGESLDSFWILLRINLLSFLTYPPFYNFVRTKQRPPFPTVHVITCLSVAAGTACYS
jgi:hypothetical protein